MYWRGRYPRLGLAFAAFLIVFAGACDDSGNDASSTTPGSTPAATADASPGANLPAGTDAERLADAVTSAADLDSALIPVTEALKLSGIGVRDADGDVSPGSAPRSSYVATPLEIVNFAGEARDPGNWRLTAADLDQMLADAGWPSDGDPGADVVSLLAEWTNAAIADADDPLSFTPLFLAEMAARQLQPVDLTDPTTDPDELQFGLLELRLFVNAFYRGAPEEPVATRTASAATPVTGTAEPDASASPTVTGVGTPTAMTPAASPQAHGRLPQLVIFQDANPCKAFADEMGVPGKLLSEVAEHIADSRLMSVLTNDLSAFGATDQATKRFEDNFQRAMTALDIISNLLSFSKFYEYGTLDVKLMTPDRPHKPKPDEKLGRAEFRAVAGVDDTDYDRYKQELAGDPVYRAFRSCRSLLTGLEGLPDIGDIADQADGWFVEWDLLPEVNKHAHLSESIDEANASKFPDSPNVFYLQGQQQMRLKRASETSAAATLYVDVKNNDLADHSVKNKEEVDGYALVQATLESAKIDFTNWALIFEALKDGKIESTVAVAPAFFESVLDVAQGWLKEIFEPKATDLLTVTYHKETCEVTAAPASAGIRLISTGAPVCTGNWSGTITAKQHYEGNTLDGSCVADEQHTLTITGTEPPDPDFPSRISLLAEWRVTGHGNCKDDRGHSLPKDGDDSLLMLDVPVTITSAGEGRVGICSSGTDIALSSGDIDSGEREGESSGTHGIDIDITMVFGCVQFDGSLSDGSFSGSCSFGESGCHSPAVSQEWNLTRE